MTFNKISASGHRFDLSRTVITRAALAHCEEYGVDYLELTMRHASGDFGSVGHIDDANLTPAERQRGAFETDDGLKLNVIAIEKMEGMILSIYPSPESEDSKIWIITHLAGTNSYTTVLLPEDY